MNNFVVVGRLKAIHEEINQIEVETIEKDNKQLLKIEVNYIFIYNIKEYCKINDVIGVKGFIKNKDDNMVLFCTRYTYLGCGKGEW